MTDMEDDDEDNDCLLIDEEQTSVRLGSASAEQPVDVNNKLNANVTQASDNNKKNITSVADSEQTSRDNIDTSPDNIVRLLKKFNYEQYCKNNPHIFNDPEEQTQQNIEKGKKHENNGGRLFCKDFARVPFDIGINLLTPDYLESPELYAHLVGNTNTSRSITDPGRSKNYGENSNAFQPATNNFTTNARRASDTLTHIPNAYGTFPETPPNTVYGNAQTESYTNIFNVIRNPSTSIHPNRHSYGFRSENMITGIPVAQNLNGTMPNPANSSGTTRGTDVSSNLERLNGLMTNNYLPPASNMHSYGPVPVSRHPGQELYPPDVRRPIYDHNMAAGSGNYGSNTNVCHACCNSKGPRAVNTSATPTLVLPGANIPNMPLCRCPGSCNIHRTGPLYPTAPPNFQVQSDFQSTALRNPYGQPLNGIGAIPRGGLFTAEAPITYAAYQQAHLTPTRRNSFAIEQPITTVMRQHTVNNTPTPAINPTQIRNEASNEMRAYAKVNTNLTNGGVINVDPSFPASSTPNHETTTSCGNISYMIPNHVASGFKTIGKNNRRARTTNKSGPKVNTRRVRAPKARASMHLQLTEMNIATTQPDKPIANLQQSTMDMSIPTEHVVNKSAYNVTDANKMQTPLSPERKDQQTKTNVHNNESQPIKILNFSKPQANEQNEKALSADTAKTYPHQTGCMKTNQPLVNTYIHQIILKAVDMAMQTNVQQSGEYNVTEGVQPSISTETCTQETLKINENNSVVLSNVYKCGASADRTPKSECDVSTTSNGLELKAPAHCNILQNNMNVNSNPVQTLISKEACMVRQDNGYTNVESKLAHMNKSSTSVPHISRAVTQTSNACDPKILTSTTTKDMTLNKDNVSHESRIDSLNTETDSRLDRMSLTINKARIPVQHGNSNMNNSENTKILTNLYLLEEKKPKIHITNPNSQKDVNENTIQPAIINTTDITLPINQVEMCISAETVPTLTSTVACVQPTTINLNVQSLQPSSPLNKNNLGTQITAPWDIETPIKQINTNEIKISALLSAKKEDAVLYLDKSDIESGPNILNINPDTLMEFNIQQDNTTMIIEDSIQPTRIGESTEIVRTSISVETCTQPNSNNTCINNVTLNSRTQNVTHNVNNTDFVSNFDHFNPKTRLTYTVIRSDTIVKHDKKDKTVDLFSLDLLRSILHNVEVNTMKDVLLTVEETKDHNESNDGTAAFKTNVSVNEDIVISKSNNDDDHEKLNIARRRLALLNMQLKNKDPDPGEYDSIISYVLQRAARNSIQKKSLDENTCIENTVRSAADILEAKKRKIQNEQEINENNDLKKSINLQSRYKCRADIKRSNSYKLHQTAGKNTENNSFVPLHQYKNNNYTRDTMRTSADVESSMTRKRKIPVHQETNENNYSETSKKRYRYSADIKQKTNYTRPTRPVQKTGSKFHYTAVLKNQIKNKKFRKETNTTPRQCLVPLRHYGQNRFVCANSRTTHTRSSADISSFKTRNRKYKNDTNKKRYIHGSDIKCGSRSRPVRETATKISSELYQTDETNSMSDDEILFFNFQIQFFRRLQERLTTKGLKESADILSSEIHRLIDISDNEDAKADMVFKCPKCNNVSTYSPRMFYCKDNHTLDESDKGAHCQRCIKFRKIYIKSLKRYIEGNTQIAKINDDTDMSDKNVKISDNSINSNDTLKIESTHNTDEEEIANQLKIDSEKIAETDGEMKHSNDELENKSIDRSDCTHIGEIADRPNIDYDAIEEQLNIITNGVPSLPKKPKFDIQNNHRQIKLQVKIPFDMLKASTVEQIKLKNNTPVTNQSTYNNATNDIDAKDKTFVINREVPKTVSTKTVISTSNLRNKNQNSTMKNNNGNIEKNKEYPVSTENADKHENFEKRRKIFESDTNKSVENRKRRTNTGTYNNHDKNNHKNCEKRKTSRDDTASRLIVQAKKSIDGVQNNTDVRENKSPDSHRVIKKTGKNCLKVCIKLKKISGKHVKVESWRTSGKEEKSYKDYRKNSSEGVDSDSKDDNDSDVNKTAKSIDNSFQSLKNNCNSKGTSDLPEVHILGETVKRLNETKNYATLKDEYSYKCHVCTAMFSYRLVYRKHMSNHNIHNKPIPIDCLYKKCEICGLKIKKIAYNYHIRTDHEDVYNARIQKPK